MLDIIFWREDVIQRQGWRQLGGYGSLDRLPASRLAQEEMLQHYEDEMRKMFAQMNEFGSKPGKVVRRSRHNEREPRCCAWRSPALGLRRASSAGMS